MNIQSNVAALILLILTSCYIPVDAAPPPTPLKMDTPQAPVTVPAISTPTHAFTQPASSPFCDDPLGHKLITSFTKAITSKDGQLLASLVSPSKGLDVRFYRDGKIVNYDGEHAKLVFKTNFQTDWGLSYGSGKPTLGSFQEIILPPLQLVFTSDAVIVCDQIKIGGATYQPIWPYQNMDFYSVHFPGTDELGRLNWQTWLMGMDKTGGQLFITALMHFVWEP